MSRFITCIVLMFLVTFVCMGIEVETGYQMSGIRGFINGAMCMYFATRK